MPLRPLQLLTSSLYALVLPAAGQLQDPDYYMLYQEAFAGNRAVLIDSDGTELHAWTSTLNMGGGTTAYLREDGLLARSGQRGVLPAGFPPGAYSTIQLVDWDGTVVWEYTRQSAGSHSLHHDFECLPNGNILMTVWEFLAGPAAEAIGWQPVAGTNGVWMERIIEVRPDLAGGTAQVVWEWYLGNHVIQDADPGNPNFGNIAANPGKVDINFSSALASGDYFHVAGMDYNAERDEIILCPNNINEIWVIDHSTSSSEAATSTGGDRGEGGALLYRWGNPAVYDHGGGTPASRILGKAHDPRWFRCPDTGDWQVTIHNNDRVDASPGDNDSQMLEIGLPLDPSGRYLLPPGGIYGPAAPRILYEIDPANPVFSSAFMGGGQHLTNGNTFIALSVSGGLIETNPAGDIIWDLDLPPNILIFMAQKYPISHPGYGPSLAITYDRWKAAQFGTGSPAGSDPGEDPDRDGCSNLFEYYAGTHPRLGESRATLAPVISGSPGARTLRVQFPRRSHVPDATGTIEFSRTLDPWVDESATLVTTTSVQTCEDGTESVVWETALPADAVSGFVRMNVSQP